MARVVSLQVPLVRFPDPKPAARIQSTAELPVLIHRECQRPMRGIVAASALGGRIIATPMPFCPSECGRGLYLFTAGEGVDRLGGGGSLRTACRAAC